MQVKQIMTTEIISVGPDDNLTEVAGKMKEKDIGWMPVLMDGKVLGVITDRDIVLRSVTTGKHPRADRALDIASQRIVSINTDATIEEASRIMLEMRVRRLLVVDWAGNAVGVISLGDIASRMRGTDLAGSILSEIADIGRRRAPSTL